MALIPDNKIIVNGLTIYEYLLTKHPSNIAMPSFQLPSRPLGITVHNTAWIETAATTTPAEQYTRATVNGNMNDVRVHYYVDDKCAWQNLPLTLSGWHAGDGDGDGNRKTISIECIMKGSGGDPISEKAKENCARLIGYLMDKYGYTIEENIYTHMHWQNVKAGQKGSIDYLNKLNIGKKYCPAYLLPNWEDFKNLIKSKTIKKVDKKEEQQAKKEVSEMVTKDLYRVRKNWEDANSQTGAYSSLDNAKKACGEGYNVYNENGVAVFSNVKRDLTPSVTYQVYTSKWNNPIVNCNDTTDMGYAGIERQAIKGLAAKSSKGDLFYRVHLKKGGWLGWISNYNINDWNKGVAGMKSKEIDGIQFDLRNAKGYKIQYRSSIVGSTNYLSWITGFGEDSMGYSGIFGKTIDKLQVKIVEEK